ncbi:MAG TPA: helix-turn-helix domain-containing protein, partial [Conexibacter sp.]|nr:helix-turn-helix domain-containing protein [Conexibacter sp.]
MEEPQRAEGSAAAGRSGAGSDAVRWDALGPAVAAKLEPAVETLVDDVFASIARRDVPREWIVGSPNARHGVEHGVRGLLALIERGPHGQLPGRGLYFGFGRVQLRAGRSLGALLSAYHHAARATWDAIAQEGDGAALPQETLHALGDAILTCLAEISAASAEGFAFEQAALSPGRADHRHQLVAALVRQPPAPPAELHALARAAGWPAPPLVAAIAFDGERAGRLAARLPAGALVARVDGLGYAIVPDPDAPGCVAGLRARLHDVHAALGPAVELERAAESARWARLALALGRDRPPALVVAADHRVDLLLLAEPALAAALADAALAPLAALPAATRERLLETLDVWLRHRGAASAAAQELHVHAQTVRYRVARLRALLGAR